ncbi:MAG: 50S ribosomal protein L16 [Candidatus Dojkabacteria bacterium]
MLQPKKRKYTKEFRGRLRGLALRGSEVSYGEYGLQVTVKGWIHAREIESARKAIANYTARKGKLWVTIFPHKPVTKKSDEVVRGGGKGPVDHFVAAVKPGRVLFELGGLDEATCKEALQRAKDKISLKSRIIAKHHFE